MLVAAHGNVDSYCESHGMTIRERWYGEVEDYEGDCLVLVTDNCEDENEYYYLKYKLRRRKIELVSTHWSDKSKEEFISYLHSRDQSENKGKFSGRTAFGFYRVNGQVLESPEAMAIARKIVELRDAGWTYRRIAEEVSHPDGRKMAVSTVQQILKNRSKYENG